MFTLWDKLSDEDKAKLQARMPRSWRPPRDDGFGVSVDVCMEEREEMVKLMAQKPKGKRAVLSRR